MPTLISCSPSHSPPLHPHLPHDLAVLAPSSCGSVVILFSFLEHFIYKPAIHPLHKMAFTLPQAFIGTALRPFQIILSTNNYLLSLCPLSYPQTEGAGHLRRHSGGGHGQVGSGSLPHLLLGCCLPLHLERHQELWQGRPNIVFNQNDSLECPKRLEGIQKIILTSQCSRFTVIS